MTDEEILAFRLSAHLLHSDNGKTSGCWPGHAFKWTPDTLGGLAVMHDYLHQPDQEPNHWHPRRRVVLRFLGLIDRPRLRRAS